MKKIFAVFAVCAGFCSCIKQQTSPDVTGISNLYTSWHVVTIESKHYNFSGPLSSDNIQNGGAADSIKFSEGDILYMIKGREHEDTYVAAEYNLLKDTVPIILGIWPSEKVYLKIVGIDDFFLTETINEVDTEDQVIYHLKKY